MERTTSSQHGPQTEHNAPLCANGSPVLGGPGTGLLMSKYGIRAKKSLGQNFLSDPVYLDRITNAAELSSLDVVLEVGPGLGALTERLLSRAGHVVAVELDRDLARILMERFGENPRFSLIQGDILKINLTSVMESAISDIKDQNCESKHQDCRFQRKVVANLPYYITTPVIMRLLESDAGFSLMVVMVQKEVALRMVAGPGSKDYGALSVAVQYRCEPRIVTHVPPGAFIPPPKVYSSVVRLKVRSRPAAPVDDEDVFFKVVKAAFGKRRKTMRNALSKGGPFGLAVGEVEEVLAAAGVDPGVRGEELGLAEFAAVANSLTAFLRGK